MFEKQIEYPKESAAAVPRWLKRAILRGLSPDPRDRFPSMDALLDALNRHPTRRRRRAQTAAAATLVAGAVALGFAVPSLGQVNPCADVADPAQVELGAEARSELRARFDGLGQPWAKALGAEVEGGVGIWVGDWVEARTEVCELRHAHGGHETALDTARVACLEEQLDRVEGLGQVLREADAPTLLEAEHFLVALPDPDACLGDAPAQVALSRQAQDERSRGLVSELDQLRWLALAAGSPSLRARTRDLVAGAEQLDQLDQRPSSKALLAEALIVDAEVDSLVGEGAEAATQLREAARVAERIGADGLRAWAKIDLGYVLSELPGHAPEAVETLEDAGALVERVGAPWHRHLRQRASLAMAYRATGELDRAAELLTELEAEFGDSQANPRRESARAQVLAMAARVALERGEPEQALGHADRALRTVEAQLGPSHPLAASPLGIRGQALTKLGRTDEAREALEAAAALRRTRLSQGSGAERQLAVDLLNLGNLESQAGEAEAAARHYGEALGLLADREGEAELAMRGLLHFNLGVDHQINGREREALASYREAERLTSAAKGPRAPLSVLARMGVGSMLVTLERFSEARAPLESALADWPASMAQSPDEAELRFALARTLTRLDGASSRTTELAQSARAIYAEAEFGPQAEAVERWLAGEPG
ncbi:serine/threonine kinase family protein [Plesiocystis pacifica SIR-1]|uniref:Serine/threonine kinase family protein n=1 Tax=Plesiocystis pacifica SIR-1 TaxID=391625 RepID=A6G4S6_9BACT|nr:tetratricopeptide repeat protein [Plesiocystis pacifica]EDM79196.1 serine/threonine kinase family protein [Plesiocystis pacifica SIR-1]